MRLVLSLNLRPLLLICMVPIFTGDRIHHSVYGVTSEQQSNGGDIAFAGKFLDVVFEIAATSTPTDVSNPPSRY